MPRRKYISSLDVAAESLRLGRVVVESDRNRTKRVKNESLAHRDRGADIYSVPSYSFSYGADGVAFTVIVYERKRWYLNDDVDGLTVMTRGADGKSEFAHFVARFDDLPPVVRAIARDVRAALTRGETAADKASARRRAKREERHHERMRAIRPQWYPNGVFSEEAQQADCDATMRIFERAHKRQLARAQELREQATQARAAGDVFTAATRDREAQRIEDEERAFDDDAAGERAPARTSRSKRAS